jgi:nucleotide-binding universal stress UspA family protein
MARILVALDGLPGSEKALEAAVKMAQQNGGQLSAVTVLKRSGDPHLAGIAKDALGQARLHLEEVLQAAVNFAKARGVRLAPMLREGHPAESIVSLAEEAKAELIVLGSHNGQAARPGLGGTADQVSSHAPCTVMIVK